jgi:F-type H+-transporting ATPase subunit delta
MLLVDRGRIACLENVIKKFIELSDKKASIEHAKLTFAVALLPQQRKALTDKLKILTGAKNIKYAVRIDPELIGGFTVQIGSKFIDFSISGQLKKISTLLGA